MADKELSDRPAKEVLEIEITPEMLNRAADCLWDEMSHDPMMSPVSARFLAEKVLLRAFAAS